MRKWKQICASAMAAVMVVGGIFTGNSAPAKAEIGKAASGSGFEIYQNEKAAPILMDVSYSTSGDQYADRTYKQIKRAAGDLRQDVAMVTGAIDFEEVQQIFADTDEKQEERLSDASIQNQVPQMLTDAKAVQDENVIIIGSLADSNLIQSLIDQGKLDEAETIQNQSESYVIKKVTDPIDGNANVKNALVIAGTDARGTIYGIYDVSEAIGVSPWYWWSDVPVDLVGKDGTIMYDRETTVEGSPSVPYRGIFINDEEQLREWAYQKKDFGWPAQVAHPGVYRHVFELLLRLKANTLWPAMHEGTAAFNSVKDADGTELVNAKNAAEYGIIMGSSHCEMMLRNNVGEWEDWYKANKTKYNIQGANSSAAWDYTINKNAILAYWEERVASNKNFENIFSMGLRGVHDGGPALAKLDTFISNKGQDNALGSTITVKGTSQEAKKVGLMKDVIHEQRKIIAKYYGSEDGAPQVFIPYKEMNEYYNYNNRDLADWLAEEASDIILMWSNDNYGYFRQTPNEQERAEGRRNGVYYHNSYWGWPKSYLWLNSASIAQMNAEMHKAYNTGANTYWILNVGDIKPGEISAEYFMKMAWDIESADDSRITETLAAQAERDFNVSQKDAEEIAQCLDRYYQYNATKRVEFYGKGYDFSVSGNGDEGMLWVNQWNNLVDRLEKIYISLDENAKDAFYEQILHAVKSSRDVAEEYIFCLKNEQAVAQGRYGSSVAYRKLGIEAVSRIKEGQNYFWSLNEEKWSHVINYAHRARYRYGDGTEWSGDYQPDQGILLKSEEDYQIAETGKGVGAACENASKAGSGKLFFSSLNKENGEAHYFDVFGKETGAADWVATAPDWIILTKKSGSIYTEERVIATVDWSKLTESTEGEIKVYNGTEASGEPVATFSVKADCVQSQLGGEKKGYQEADGYVMIEAEQWSENVAGTDGTKWQKIQSLGQRGDSIRITTKDENKVNMQQGDVSAYNEFANGTLSEADKAKVGHVAYDVYFEKAGTYKFIAYRLPTLDESTTYCRTAVVVNGESSDNAWLRGTATTLSNTWSGNILHMIESLQTAQITVKEGWNRIELYRMSPSQAFDRFLIVTDSSVAPPLSDMEMGMPISPNNIVADGELKEFQKWRIGSLSERLGQKVGITVISGRREVRVGGSMTLETKQSGTEKCELEWSSSDESVARVKDGVITGVAVGSAKITVKLKQGETMLDSDSVVIKVYGKVGKQIADLSLDGTENGFHGAGAKVSLHAKDGSNTAFPYKEIDGRKGVYFDTSRWLEVTKDDGTPLMKGLSEFTISYDSYVTSASISNYSFFMTNTYEDGKATAANSSTYPRFGISDYAGTLRVLNGGGTFDAAAAGNKWKHVDVVYTGNDVTTYIDGKMIISNEAFDGIKKILNADKSYLWIGKGPFLPLNSQIFSGYLANYRIYDYALLTDEIQKEMEKDDNQSGAATPKPEETSGATVSPKPDNKKTVNMSLSKSKITLYTGKASNSAVIKATVTGTPAKVLWKSSNSKVAAVKNGKITAVKKGTATVTATVQGISRTVKVKVKNPSIIVKKGKKVVSKVRLKVKKKGQFTVKTSPKKAGLKLSSLSKKNKKILSAKIKNGKLTVKAKKKGKVVLVLKSGKGKKKITITVK